jgi:hypothetical protein
MLPDDAPIRFHPRSVLGSGPSKRTLPALLARMSDPLTGDARGVVRIYVHPEGHGKADGVLVKPMLGPAGVVRLVPDEEVGESLGVAEGIETSLAVMQMGGWRPVWSCVTAGGISTFPVVPGITSLTIFADTGAAGESAAEECARRWCDAGREVEILTPPDGVSDWLDQFRAERAGRAA